MLCTISRQISAFSFTHTVPFTYITVSLRQLISNIINYTDHICSNCNNICFHFITNIIRLDLKVL